MTVLASLLVLAAIFVTAALAVLGTIAGLVEILPPRPGQSGDEPLRVSAASTPRSHPQNRMPTRIGMKSQ